MRRALAALVLSLAALVPAGCLGPDGQKALELLERANQAQQQLESARFDLSVLVEGGGQNLRIDLQGGAYVRGERAGDGYFAMSGQGLPIPPVEIVSTDGLVLAKLDGRWQHLPGVTAQPDGAVTDPRPDELAAQLAGLDLTRFVKDVKVTEGQVFEGEPATRVEGTIDTQALAESALQEAATSLGSGGALPDLGQLDISDTTAMLWISDRTGLVRAAIVSVSIDAAGETGTVSLRYALRGVNEPIELPAIPKKALKAAKKAASQPPPL